MELGEELLNTLIWGIAGVILVAIIAVIVSDKFNTTGTITSATNFLAADIKYAVNPQSTTFSGFKFTQYFGDPLQFATF